MPAVQASPSIAQVTVREQDEMVLIASREPWEYLLLELIVDIARYESADLMRAAQRLGDLAIAFGASGKIMVMMISVSDLKKRGQVRPHRVQSLSFLDDRYAPKTRTKKKKKGNNVEDSMLRPLQTEVPSPVDNVSIVSTDVKSSTLFCETSPSAIQSHQCITGEPTTTPINELAALPPNSQLMIDCDCVWTLWDVNLRLEMLCSSLDDSPSLGLQPTETRLVEQKKHRSVEVTDQFGFMAQQVSRIEVYITFLSCLSLFTSPFPP